MKVRVAYKMYGYVDVKFDPGILVDLEDQSSDTLKKVEEQLYTGRYDLDIFDIAIDLAEDKWMEGLDNDGDVVVYKVEDLEHDEDGSPYIYGENS